MNNLLRSKSGCWTCRLRKKKCDERKPSPCSTCESLAITCYGYGTKPDWMDNGPREKEMANSIKQIVKHTSRRKGRLTGSNGAPNNGVNTEASTINIAPKTATAPARTISTAIEDTAYQKTSSGSSPTQSSPSISAETSTGTTPESGNRFFGTPAITSNEAALLMHFVDNVFPLQYPMYKPEVSEGGRGWLLSLLLKTKPLYHASIGLSAYHRGVVLRELTSGGCTKPSIAEQESHLAICLTEFQEAIRSAQDCAKDCVYGRDICVGSSLAIMACVVQLVFFELFGVQKSSWQIHLRAATDLFGQGYRAHAAELGLWANDESTAIVLPTACELLNNEPSIIFLFLSGAVMWLDVVSCITTGKSPQLLDLHHTAFGRQIKLEKIMGCKNWVMTEIGRISTLHEFKRNGLQSGTFDAHSFEIQADVIRQAIQRGLNEQFLTELRITNPKTTSHGESRISDQAVITRLFTRAACIYLELVVHGFKVVEEKPDLYSIIAEPLMMLPTILHEDLIRAIVCPLYILGCVAKVKERDTFRKIFSAPSMNDPFMHHRSTILPFLENVWILRDTHSNNVSWECVLQLSDDKTLLL
ncbi:putative c6 transcription protein [Botrytis fragariae]|uniref:Putative c6 transcription protein n=1 Tax=Botrytis fragariae TaxID=1964551 RepID=A0A8H6AK74_9HELO|nr:putative c6 transcription protein [Botrytis fragariae]KAF5868962.1 putative c6 transcription protein [Botrytis fragariae]